MRRARFGTDRPVPASFSRRLMRDCACFALLALARKRSTKHCRCGALGLFLRGRSVADATACALASKLVVAGSFACPHAGAGCGCRRRRTRGGDQQQRARSAAATVPATARRRGPNAIGRFVQQQQVRGLHQRAAEVQPARQPPEKADTACRCVSDGNPRPCSRRPARFGVVATQFFQPLVCGGNAFPVLGLHGGLLGRARRRDLGITSEHEVQRGVRQPWRFLRDAGDAQSWDDRCRRHRPPARPSPPQNSDDLPAPLRPTTPMRQPAWRAASMPDSSSPLAAAQGEISGKRSWGARCGAPSADPHPETKNERPRPRIAWLNCLESSIFQGIACTSMRTRMLSPGSKSVCTWPMRPW